VNHYFDWVTGMFDERDLVSILVTGLSPGLTASMSFGLSQSGYSSLHPLFTGMSWYERGRVAGPELQHWMENYRRTLSIVVFADDEVDHRNGVTIDPAYKDEHGPVPKLSYVPGQRGEGNRNELVKISVEILRKAGAKKVLRTDWPASLMIHMESTMRIGFVVDDNCGAYQTKRLYIADNSVHFNALGGANPTLTTQALATRTAEKLVEKYF
jgi:choline dehydrogenase-like flavoprotein